jgi:hypothetical protein
MGGENMRKREPTNGTNATSRLFLRFFLAYLLTAPVAILIATNGLLDLNLKRVGLIEFFFIPLSLLGAFLTVTKPYLIILSVIKSFYDVALLYRVSQWARLGAIGILPWNACLLLLIFSLILFCFSAARAELFSFLHTQRDLRLILSRPFGAYLLEMLLFTALALSLYYLMPELFNTFGMIPTPLE